MAGTPPERDLGPAAVPIWELPEAGERGPKPRYSRAMIAAAAVRIADAGGLAAVSMRRVAAGLGMGTMSLYNYVPAKDHLIQMMLDQASGEYVYPQSPPPDIRAAIVDLAGQGRQVARRHPWVAELMFRPPPMGPSAFRYLDYFLGLLSGSPLGGAAKMEIISLVNGFAIMYGTMESVLAGGGVSAEQHTAAQVAALARAAGSGRYPHLAAVLASGEAPPSPDEQFRSVVLRLVDGLLAAGPAGQDVS